MSLTLPGYTQVWDDPLNVTCIPGAATTSSCKILVVSLNDPAVTPVIVTVNGVSYSSASDFTNAMVPVNTDGAATVMWAGMVQPTGLDAFTRYSWSVAQGSDADAGSFMTLPQSGDDFTLLFGSCDSTRFSAIGTEEAAHYGIWRKYKQWTEQANPPVAGLFFVDDYGYVDSHDVYDATGNTGLDFNNAGGAVDPASDASLTNGAAEYNYALGWAEILGLCGGDETALSDRMFGRATERAWCRKNLNLYIQWGDHEFKNDIGWDNATGLVLGTPTPMHATVGGFDGAAYLTFERLFGLIRPDMSDVITPSNTRAKHWALQMGDAALIAPDFITEATGTAPPSYVGPSYGQLTAVFKSDQIDDLLNAADTIAAPFTIFGMACGLRYPQDASATVTEFNSGNQHPLYNHCLTEYQKLMTASGGTPKSVMDNPKLNGAYGTTVFLQGDYHRGNVYEYNKAAYTGNLAEEFYEITVGTLNGSTNFTPAAAGPVASSPATNDIELHYVSQGIAGDHDFWGLRVDVIGSAPTKYMLVDLIDRNYASVWKRKFGHRKGNFGYDPDAIIELGSKISANNLN